MSREARNRPRFSFRPNMERSDHREAWEALQAVPEGRKNAFLVEAILFRQERGSLENLLRRVIREELGAASSRPVEQGLPEPEIPGRMFDFLQAITDETDET